MEKYFRMAYRITEVECKASRKVRSTRRAESETTGGPSEKAGASSLVGHPNRERQQHCRAPSRKLTQSPFSRRMRRKAGRVNPNSRPSVLNRDGFRNVGTM